MIGTLKKGQIFLILYAAIITGCTIILLSYTKEDIHVWINSRHSGQWDVFFKLITHIGAGLTAICFSLILLFRKYGYALIVFSSYIVSSLIVQILKRLIFPQIMRPTRYFLGKADLYIVPGFEPNVMQSFPSGHTASAFALFLSLSLISKNKWLQIAFVISAIIVGYSRLYLSEHFLIDVFAGSLIGVITTLVVYYLYLKNKKDWMDKHLKFGV